MNAAVIHAFDAPPRYASFADPVPGGEEVLVSVSAAGLHPVVKSLVSGKHYASTGQLPLIPGIDGVGRLKDGTRVYFGALRSPYGSFAEISVTRPAVCLPVPETLDDVTVAAIMNPAMSSWAALKFRAQFAAGESVLILGATGVAGQLAVQVAKRLGARRVIAAGRNPAVLKELERLGADAVISLNLEPEALVTSLRQECARNRIEVVLDYLWGSPAERVLDALSQRGLQPAAWRIRFVQVGSSAGATITLPAAALRSSGLELIGSGLGGVSMEKILQSARDFLSEATREAFEMKTRTAPLREVEALWNVAGEGARLVLQPT